MNFLLIAALLAQVETTPPPPGPPRQPQLPTPVERTLKNGWLVRGGFSGVASAAPDGPLRTCRIGYCSLWARGTSVFCYGHDTRWKNNGRPVTLGGPICMRSSSAMSQPGGKSNATNLTESTYAASSMRSAILTT